MEAQVAIAQAYALRAKGDIKAIRDLILFLLGEMALGERETAMRKAAALQLMAQAAQKLGKLDEALSQAREAVELLERYQPGSELLAYAWKLLAEVYSARGEPDEAARALGEAERFRD